MIKVSAVYINDKFQSLQIVGHGGLDFNQDIYCAGVSTCLIGALNTLDESEKFDLKIKSGDSSIIRIEKITYHDEIVLETLIKQLQTLSDSYPDRVSINISRKEG